MDYFPTQLLGGHKIEKARSLDWMFFKGMDDADHTFFSCRRTCQKIATDLLRINDRWGRVLHCVPILLEKKIQLDWRRELSPTIIEINSLA